MSQTLPDFEPRDVLSGSSGPLGLSSLDSLIPQEKIVSLLDKKYGKQSMLVKVVALLTSNGFTTQDIADELGLPVSEIQNVLAQPATKEHLKRLMLNVSPERLNAIIKAVAVDAIIKMSSLLHSIDDRTSFAASKYIIDRSLGDSEKPSKPLLRQEEVTNPKAALDALEQQIQNAQRRLSVKLPSIPNPQ
jgi:hypothetical protein